MGFVEYMGNKIWLPVLIAVGVALIILVIIWLICRHRGQRRYNKIILDEERSLIQKWDDEKRMQKMAERDAVLLNCYYYLKDSKKYSFIDHLPDIGSRMNKQWFLVRDSKHEIDAVLTMVPWSLQCTLTFNKATRKTLKELFSLLQMKHLEVRQKYSAARRIFNSLLGVSSGDETLRLMFDILHEHVRSCKYPYLLPVMDVDFVFEHNLVMFIHPFRSAGSLKDAIYGSRPQSSWEEKYQVKGKSLSLAQIRNYGRQVLEALLYLREKGLPACGHLHSGNIFVVNGTAKLSGFENSLFGWKSRLYPIVKRLIKDNQDDIEVIQFGHLLYEMVAGWELTTSEPKREQLTKIRNAPVVEVISFIFFNENETYPTLDELVAHPFFRGGDVRGLNKFNPGPVRFSSNVKQLLKLCRNDGEEGQRKRKVSTAMKSTSDDGAVPTRERNQLKSKGKRLSVDKTSLPAVQFHPMASPPPKSPPPPPKEAPPPPRTKRTSVSKPLPPKPPNSAGRGALLSQIQKGTRLKSTKTNDRSAPRV